jgi:hypothetical protein
MDRGVTTIGSAVLVGSATSNYIKKLSKNNGMVNAPLTADSGYTFGVSNALVGTSAMTFDNEGHLVATGDPY